MSSGWHLVVVRRRGIILSGGHVNYDCEVEGMTTMPEFPCLYGRCGVSVWGDVGYLFIGLSRRRAAHAITWLAAGILVPVTGCAISATILVAGQPWDDGYYL